MRGTVVRKLLGAATALALAVSLSSCGGVDDLADLEPDWTGPVAEGTMDMTAAKRGDMVVMASREGIWIADLEEGSDWTHLPFKDLAPDHSTTVAEMPNVTVYEETLLVTSQEVGVHLVELRTGELLFRDDSAGSTAVAFDGLFVSSSCDEDSCHLVGHSIDDGDELWTSPVQGTDVELVPPDVPRESIRSQAMWVMQDRLAPAKHDVVLARPQGGDSSLTSVDVETGEVLSEIDLSPESTYRFIASSTLLQWGGPDDDCQVVVHGRDMRTGETWEQTTLFRADDSMDFHEPCAEHVGSPRISDGMILTATRDGEPLVLDGSTGDTIWQGDDSAQVALGYVDGVVVTAERDGETDLVIATDVSTGDEVWSLRVERALTQGWPVLGLSPSAFAFESTAGDDATVITVVDMATGDAAVTSGPNHLLSMGSDWVVTVDSTEYRRERTLSVFTIA